MSLIVRAYPLRRPVEDLKAFAAALGARQADTDTFYREYGVSHESWHVQETPQGAWVIGVTVIDDAAPAAERYARSSSSFDTWFKQQVLQLSGINPDEQPLGPPTTQVFVWPHEQSPDRHLF